jgi:two-component system sensor histidine kinase PilS (NtrC family)
MSASQGQMAFPWKPLQLFNAYRVFIAMLFLSVWLSGMDTRDLGRVAPQLYLLTLLAYLGLSLTGALCTRMRRPPFGVQVGLLATADVVFVILLTHASGGIASGLGVLLIPAVGAVGVLLPGVWALFTAAIASLLLILDQIYLFLSGIQDNHAYTPAGLIGLALFATALISTHLANRARASEALALSRGLDLANLTELSEYIVEHLESGVIVTDNEGQIRLVNQHAWDLLGHPVGVQRTTLDTLSPQLFRQFLMWQKHPENNQRPIRLPGRNTRLQTRFTPLGINREAILITVEDQGEIVAQIQAAKLASLGRLSASIAHEIRNPLSGITHATQLLEEATQLEAADRRLIEIIRTQGQRIDRIIDDVLRLSRKEPPSTSHIDLSSWLHTRAEELRAQLRIGIDELRLNLIGNELDVEFDEGHLTQIIAGLCENANRYGRNRQGTLELTLAAHRSPQARQVMLDVLDTGPGIAAADLPHLFEPFFTTSAAGTGLGLYISRELCALNGATLEYLPVPGSGSCFRLRLPAASAANNPKQP